MTPNHQEIESKFYVRNLEGIAARLETLGARCIVPRGFEYNLRYDDPAGSLRADHKVLRLRKFDDVRLTFKGPGETIGGALARTEIELVINDFEAAQEFLSGLGYEIVMIYEKYRSIHALEDAIITLDELPYGKFVEIEAENPENIQNLARALGLKPKTAIPNSYQGLFEQVKKTKRLDIQHLTFSAFSGIQVYPDELGVRPADEV